MNFEYNIETIEKEADQKGRGSVFRACLAVFRSCPNKNLGILIMELGYKYAVGISTAILQPLSNICNSHINANQEGEFHEALKALRNAIEIAPKPLSKKEQTQELWQKLERSFS